MEYSIRLLTAASLNENIDGKERTMVYLFGTTKDGESIAVRTPLLMPYFQIVEPTKDILKTLEQRDDVENIESALRSLESALHAMGTELYSQASEDPTPGDDETDDEREMSEEDVIDADFEEAS